MDFIDGPVTVEFQQNEFALVLLVVTERILDCAELLAVVVSGRPELLGLDFDDNRPSRFG